MKRFRVPSLVLAASVTAVVLCGALPAEDTTESALGRVCGFRMLAAARAAAWHGSKAALEPTSPVAKALVRLGTGAANQSPPEIDVGTELPFPLALSFSQVVATCRYKGDHVFVFVENRHWDTEGGSILQSHVDGLGELFDSSTPADPERGVFELTEEAFGRAPDVDGYAQIFVLVLDIPDPRFVGYFDPAVADHDVPELRRDVVYLDEFAVRRRSYLSRGTLAHEFQHLIHWGHDDDEIPWVNEGLSGYAEELVGYPEADPSAVPRFLERPDRTGIGLNGDTWRDSTYNYGSTYLFMSYLAQRFGLELIRELVDEPRNGRDGLNNAFASLSLDETFESVWERWVVANYAVVVDGFAYSALNGRRAQSFVIDSLPLAPIDGEVGFRWGTVYVLFRTPGDVAVDFVGEEVSRFRVWIYAKAGEESLLERVELDDANRGAAAVAGIDSLVLIVGRTSLQGEGRFSISARAPVLTAILSPEQSPSSGRGFRIEAGYPNPFNGAVHIPYHLESAAAVSMSVYDAAGQRLVSRTLGRRSPGRHEAIWDGRSDDGKLAASGRYLVQLKAADGPARVLGVTLAR